MFATFFQVIHGNVIVLALMIGVAFSYVIVLSEKFSKDFIIQNTLPVTKFSPNSYLFHHNKHNCKLIHISENDRNNFFAVVLKTSPFNDNGVPLLLNKIVNSGSMKYNTDGIFDQLLKVSISSTITYQLTEYSTIYYFSTSNVKEFFNILDVMLDSIFNTLIDEHSFDKYCFGYEMENGSISIHGEALMDSLDKFSDFNNIIRTEIQKNLFPESNMKYRPFGSPVFILNNTHESLYEHHKILYHPSNAFFFYYGKIRWKYITGSINKVINSFPVMYRSHTPYPSDKWSKPKQKVFQIGGKVNNSVIISWHVGDVRNISDMFDIEILTRLLKHEKNLYISSFFQRVSKFPSDCFINFIKDVPTPFVSFHISMPIKSSEKIVNSLLETFKNISKYGFANDIMRSTLINFDIDFNSIHRQNGYVTFDRFSSMWVHGAESLDIMSSLLELERVKRIIYFQPQYFGILLTEKFIHNNRRLDLILDADSNYTEPNITDDIYKKTLRLRSVDFKRNYLRSNKSLPHIKLDDITINLPTDCVGRRNLYHISTNTSVIKVVIKCELTSLNNVSDFLSFFGRTQVWSNYTSGFNIFADTYKDFESSETKAAIYIDIKTTNENYDHLINSLNDLLFNVENFQIYRAKKWSNLVQYSVSMAESAIDIIGFYRMQIEKEPTSNATQSLLNAIDYYKNIFLASKISILYYSKNEYKPRLEPGFTNILRKLNLNNDIKNSSFDKNPNLGLQQYLFSRDNSYTSISFNRTLVSNNSMVLPVVLFMIKNKFDEDNRSSRMIIDCNITRSVCTLTIPNMMFKYSLEKLNKTIYFLRTKGFSEEEIEVAKIKSFSTVDLTTSPFDVGSIHFKQNLNRDRYEFLIKSLLNTTHDNIMETLHIISNSTKGYSFIGPSNPFI